MALIEQLSDLTLTNTAIPKLFRDYSVDDGTRACFDFLDPNTWGGTLPGGAIAASTPLYNLADGPIFNGYISGTTLTVTSVVAGNIANGCQLALASAQPYGGTVIATISGYGTGTGGTGTYTVTPSQTTGSSGAPVMFFGFNGNGAATTAIAGGVGSAGLIFPGTGGVYATLALPSTIQGGLTTAHYGAAVWIKPQMSALGGGEGVFGAGVSGALDAIALSRTAAGGTAGQNYQLVAFGNYAAFSATVPNGTVAHIYCDVQLSGGTLSLTTYLNGIAVGATSTFSVASLPNQNAGMQIGSQYGNSFTGAIGRFTFEDFTAPGAGTIAQFLARDYTANIGRFT